MHWRFCVAMAATLTMTACGNDPGKDTSADSDTSPYGEGEPPFVGALQFTTPEDTPLNFALVASDVDGDALTFAWTGTPTFGVITGTLPDVTYTPNANANGTDVVAFTVSDGANVVDASVTVNINAVNDAPTFTPVPEVVTEEDTPVQISLVVTDVDGDSLTVEAVNPPDFGSMSGQVPTLLFEPQSNWFGTDAVVFQLSDGIDTLDIAFDLRVTPVNDAPVVVDNYYVGVEDVEFFAAESDLLADDLDQEGHALTIVSVGPSTPPVNLGLVAGSWRVTPDVGFVGEIVVPYTISDGALTGEGKFVVTFEAANDGPTGVGDAYDGTEDQILSIPAPGVLENDTDFEGDGLSAVVVDGPVNGTLDLADDGSFEYTPDPDFNGADSFSYTVSDGMLTHGPIAVSLNVVPVNDDPLAFDDNYVSGEDLTLAVDAVDGVLANDDDIDGDQMYAELLLGVLHGTLDLEPDGSFVYQPDPGYSGADDFVYQVTDDFGGLSFGGAVTLTVNALEDVPAANDDTYAATEDAALVVPALTGLLANDSDGDGDPLSVSGVGSPPSHGTVDVASDGSFTYTPAPDWFGTDSFSVDVTDGKGTSASLTTVNVASVDDAPVASDDSYLAVTGALVVDVASGVLANDTDLEGDPLTAVLGTGPDHGDLVLAVDGSFVYTPDAGYGGFDFFSYAANDGLLNSNNAVVMIEVTPPNEAPEATNDFYSATGGVLLIVDGADGVLSNDIDPEGLPLEAILVDPPEHGVLALHIEGSFDYAPEADFAGIDEATYIAVDVEGATSELTTIIFLVDPAPVSPPVAVADSYDGFEDTEMDIDAPGVLENDVGDNLAAALMALPLHGAVTLNADGSFHYGARSPLPEDYDGVDTFSYVATNVDGVSNMASVSLVLAAVDDAPRGNDDFYAVALGDLLDVAAPGVLENDVDPEGDPLSATAYSAPVAGVFLGQTDGSFTYEPPLVPGDYVLTYTPTANGLLGAPNTVHITVFDSEALEGDRAARTRKDEFVSTGNFLLQVSAASGLLANDFDPDGDDMVVTAGTFVTDLGGTVDIDADGAFTYAPATGLGDAVDSFRYEVASGVSFSSGSVDVHLVGRAWWVDNTASGDGRSDRPFSSLDEALAAATAGDVVRVLSGDGSSWGLSFGLLPEAGITVQGAGLPLLAQGRVLEAAGVVPELYAPGGLVLPVGVSIGGALLDLDGSRLVADRGVRLQAVDLVGAGVVAVSGSSARANLYSFVDTTADGSLDLVSTQGFSAVTLVGSTFTAFAGLSAPDGTLLLDATDSSADLWTLTADGAFVLASLEDGECMDTDLGTLADRGNTARDGGEPIVTVHGALELRAR